MSDYVAHTETIRGYTVEIIADTDGALDPRRDYSQLGVMLCEHPRYTLGDTDDAAPYKAALERFAEGRFGLRAFVRWLRVFHGTTVVLPLYLYDHSGITMSAGADLLAGSDPNPMSRRGRFGGDGAGWDTSTVGLIFDTAERRKEIGTPVEHVEEVLRGEVSEYALHLEGNVYGYVITNPSGDEVGACWGFISEPDGHVLEEARLSVPDEPAESAEAAEARKRQAVRSAVAAHGDAEALLAEMIDEAPLTWLTEWAKTHLPTD
jgi:hypothetical protein